MRWKKVLIAASLFILVLIVGIYAVLALYDFNKFKPMIARAVKDATGRELTISGNIDFDFGVRPTLVVEDVSFQNASWSSKSSLARVKRLEVQLAVLPMIMGNFDFVHLVLIEPDIIVEFNSAGISNFSFDTINEKKEKEEIQPPPIGFSNVQIEKGLFTYQDAQSNIKFSIHADRLQAEIPGLDKSLKVDFEGAFNDISFTLNGTLGPIWAWIEPGYSLPANLTIGAGGAMATIKGQIRDPINLKNLAFNVAAEGSSIAKIANLAGVSNMPELGAFKLAAKLGDPEGNLAIEELEVQIGTDELATLSLIGYIKNVFTLQGVMLNFSARGRDAAQLSKLGITLLPRRGPFQLTAMISDPKPKVYLVEDLNVSLYQNEINGQMVLNLAEQVPFLRAELASPNFELGPASLDLHLTGPLKKPAIKNIDFKFGTAELAEVRLKGKVEDLMELEGVDINFQASGKALANLEQLIGQPLPVRGAFSATGKAFIPVQKNLLIPDLKMIVGKNNITGSLNLDLREDKPQLKAKLALQKLDLPSVLLPKFAGQDWAKGLNRISPVKIDVKLVGFPQEFAVKKIDLHAGTLASAELYLTGSVENLVAQRGIDLKFYLRGNEVANLGKITGQSIPLKGAYTLSGKLTDPGQKKYKVSDLALKLGKNNITGRLDFNLSGKQFRLSTEMTAPKFNLRSVSLPAFETLSQIEDLGSLKLAFSLAGGGNKLTLDNLNVNFGREDLIEVLLKGTISDLSAVRGLDLEFSAKGNDMSSLKRMGGPAIPFQGAFFVSGHFIDPAPKVYKIPSFNAAWGDNKKSGWLELDLSGKRPHLKGELASDKLDLRPLFAQEKKRNGIKAQAVEPVFKNEKTSKPKTIHSKSDAQKVKIFPAEPLPLEGLQAIDADLKFRDKQVLLPSFAIDDVIVDILLKNGDLEIKPFKFTIGGGQAEVQFALRSQEQPAALAIALKIDQMELGLMLDELGYQRSVEGNMDAAFNLDGSGYSIAALMAGLNGNIRIAMSDGWGTSEYLDLLVQYFGRSILQMINPFKKKREFTPINCFVNKIDIKDGLADIKILLDTDHTSILGAGQLNLKTEALDLGIKPMPKEVAGRADVTFSLRKLSQPFRLGGTLGQPSLIIDRKGSAFVLGKLGVALALGPVGVTAFLADFSTGKKDICKLALEKEDQPIDGKHTIEKEEAKDEKEKKGNFLKRLFGR